MNISKIYKKYNFLSIEMYFIFFSFFILWINTRSLLGSELIFSGDQYFPFNLQEVKKNLDGIFDYKNLGINNAWKFNIHFVDNLIYYTLYYFRININIVQYIIHFIIFYLILRLSYQGFKKFSTDNNLLLSNFQVLSIAFIYSYCPYFVQLLHGTVVNITLAIAYGLMPLTFLKLNQYFLSNEINYRDGIILSTLISIIMLPFWFFASFGLLIALFFINLLIFKKIKHCFFKVTFLISTLLPLIGFQLYNIIYEKVASVGLNPDLDGPVFGNISGGMITQLKMLHSWGIYNIWHPRYLYPFAEHYISNMYNLIIIVLYMITIFGVYKTFKNNVNHSKNILTFFIVMFFVFTFLAKGPSYPFGDIFIYLYENVPLFSVFRTPDIRFGYLIIFCLSFIIILVYKNINIINFHFKLILITIFLSLPFFNGEALVGKNIGNIYFDKVIKIPNSYLEVASFLNNNTTKNDFIFDLTMNDYKLFNLDKDIFVGQNLLQKIVNSPMVFATKSSPMNFQTIEILDFIKKTNNFNLLENYPIKYVIFEKFLPENQNFIITKDLTLVFENSSHFIYKLTKVLPLINACDSIINNNNNNFLIKFTQNCKGITLALNYNSGWQALKLREGNSSAVYIWILKALNVFKESSIKSKSNDYYQIFFDLNSQVINKGDTVIVYYEPSFISKFLVYVFFFFIIIYSFFIFRSNILFIHFNLRKLLFLSS